MVYVEIMQANGDWLRLAEYEHMADVPRATLERGLVKGAWRVVEHIVPSGKSTGEATPTPWEAARISQMADAREAMAMLAWQIRDAASDLFDAAKEAAETIRSASDTGASGIDPCDAMKQLMAEFDKFCALGVAESVASTITDYMAARYCPPLKVAEDPDHTAAMIDSFGCLLSVIEPDMEKADPDKREAYSRAASLLADAEARAAGLTS